MFKNIWQHPKTTAAGLLIAVSTIAGVLAQNGVTLGHAGAGTGVALASALATALLGLLARDPAPAAGTVQQQKSTTAQLGAMAMIALLLSASMTACNGQNVAQNIVNWTPALQSAVVTVDSTIAVLDPAEAPIFAAATVGFTAASNLLVAQAKAYLANPSATVLAQLQTQVVTFQQQVNAALLQAAKITNPASQQQALAAINGVATIVTAILALVTSISNKAQMAKMVAASPVKLAQVEQYEDLNRASQIVADHYGVTQTVAALDITRASVGLQQAGF